MALTLMAKSDGIHFGMADISSPLSKLQLVELLISCAIVLVQLIQN